jgi:hypothetical protein
MKTNRPFFLALATGVLLGALLGTPSALADRADCEASCATKGGESLQNCMDRCGEPVLPGKGGGAAKFQACATRCTDKYKQTFNECAKKCPKDGPSGKEKAKSLPRDEEE